MLKLIIGHQRHHLNDLAMQFFNIVLLIETGGYDTDEFDKSPQISWEFDLQATIFN
jgi:predicted oxidoreductase